MKATLSLIILIALATWAHAQDFVTISGKVTDYQGRAVDSCNVIVYNPDFTEAYETYSDSTGHYKLDSIPKGRYAALAAMRVKEYPRMQQVAPRDMRLEFWAWNVIAESDITLNLS